MSEEIGGTPSYDDWLSGAPEGYRSRFEQEIGQSAYDQFYTALNEQVGDVLPVFNEFKDDKDFRKKVARLKDGNVRQLFEMALDSYDRSAVPNEPSRDPLRDEVAEINQKLANQEQRRLWENYHAARDTEYQALMNEYPQLKGNPKLGEHIREVAEARTMRNLQNGKPNAIPFKTVWDEWQGSLAAAPDPNNAPAVTSSGPPPKDQQPARDRALSLVKQAGGFSGLQRALEAKKG